MTWPVLYRSKGNNALRSPFLCLKSTAAFFFFFINFWFHKKTFSFCCLSVAVSQGLWKQASGEWLDKWNSPLYQMPIAREKAISRSFVHHSHCPNLGHTSVLLYCPMVNAKREDHPPANDVIIMCCYRSWFTARVSIYSRRCRHRCYFSRHSSWTPMITFEMRGNLSWH